ncbi:hypothetical protein M0R04_03675 [Candidatus Dojkabacteria bacterium]|jgi:DNA polymerase III delta prime subunit|nr:hypothetical protein [Candidatus Dojkabacteria bacterium]
MTHIVIHTNKDVREKYLVKLLSFILKREGLTQAQLFKIPDIHLLKTDENSIGIDDVKKLQKEMVYQPFEEEYQIAIISDCFKLTEEAQNSLLKTLEEQSNTTIYILMLDNERNILPTILSRGVKHYVKEKGEEEETIKPKILELNLIEKFKEIEKVSKGSTNDVVIYLTEIQKYFRKSLRENIENEKKSNEYFKKIEKVETAITRIRGNGNKRLVLENLMLNI